MKDRKKVERLVTKAWINYCWMSSVCGTVVISWLV